MSTLGKVLLFINLLLAVGVVYLTTQDYAIRQGLNANVLRYELVQHGLPVDPVAGDSGGGTVLIHVPGVNGNATLREVEKDLLDKLFRSDTAEGLPTTAPRNQIEELKRVYDDIKKEVDSREGDAKRVAYLCGTIEQGRVIPGRLMALAETFEERELLRKNGRPGLPPEALAAARKDAEERLARKFEGAMAPVNASQAATELAEIEDLKAKIVASPNDKAMKQKLAAYQARGGASVYGSDLERRRKIAELLMLANPAPGYQKRVALTVGLNTYLSVLTAVATRLDGMYRRVERAIESDQGNFEAQYELLKKYAFEMDQLVEKQERVVVALGSQLATQKELTTKRTAQLASLKEDLATVTAKVNQLLADQATTEKTLFNVQQQVGQAIRTNGLLEEQLRKKETE